MTRRSFLSAPPATLLTRRRAPLDVPVHRVLDKRAKIRPEHLRRFWSTIWPEAARDFGHGGMRLQTTDSAGEVRFTASDKPIFTGLRRGIINLILTGHIPLYWDGARALPGVTTIYEGFHVCVIALEYTHGNQAPFLSVNTVVHELLHLLLQDVFVKRPSWYQESGREFRADWYATSLWLFHDGAAIRQSAQAYLARLRSLRVP